MNCPLAHSLALICLLALHSILGLAASGSGPAFREIKREPERHEFVRNPKQPLDPKALQLERDAAKRGTLAAEQLQAARLGERLSSAEPTLDPAAMKRLEAALGAPQTWARVVDSCTKYADARAVFSRIAGMHANVREIGSTWFKERFQVVKILSDYFQNLAPGEAPDPAIVELGLIYVRWPPKAIETLVGSVQKAREVSEAAAHAALLHPDIEGMARELARNFLLEDYVDSGSTVIRDSAHQAEQIISREQAQEIYNRSSAYLPKGLPAGVRWVRSEGTEKKQSLTIALPNARWWNTLPTSVVFSLVALLPKENLLARPDFEMGPLADRALAAMEFAAVLPTRVAHLQKALKKVERSGEIKWTAVTDGYFGLKKEGLASEVDKEFGYVMYEGVFQGQVYYKLSLPVAKDIVFFKWEIDTLIESARQIAFGVTVPNDSEVERISSQAGAKTFNRRAQRFAHVADTLVRLAYYAATDFQSRISNGSLKYDGVRLIPDIDLKRENEGIKKGGAPPEEAVDDARLYLVLGAEIQRQRGVVAVASRSDDSRQILLRAPAEGAVWITASGVEAEKLRVLVREGKYSAARTLFAEIRDREQEKARNLEAQVKVEEEKRRQEEERAQIEEEQRLEGERIREREKAAHWAGVARQAVVAYKAAEDFLRRLSTVTLEQESFLEALLVNTVAKRHILIFGVSGIGKTYTTELFFKGITFTDEEAAALGAHAVYKNSNGSWISVYGIDGTPATRDSELIGDYNLAKMNAGEGAQRMWWLASGGKVYVFIDEFDKIDYATVASILKNMENGEQKVGGNTVQTNSEVFVVAMNMTPEEMLGTQSADIFTLRNKLIKAFLSRVGSVFLMTPIAELESQMEIQDQPLEKYLQANRGRTPELPNNQIKALRQVAENVTLPVDVRRMISLVTRAHNKAMWALQSEDKLRYDRDVAANREHPGTAVDPPILHYRELFGRADSTISRIVRTITALRWSREVAEGKRDETSPPSATLDDFLTALEDYVAPTGVPSAHHQYIFAPFAQARQGKTRIPLIRQEYDGSNEIRWQMDRMLKVRSALYDALAQALRDEKMENTPIYRKVKEYQK